MIETTLATQADRIRQLAFDGSMETWFATAGLPTATDHFTLVFDKPVALREVRVVTGGADGAPPLEAGVLEGSVDGKTFSELSRFRDGAATAHTDGQQIVAVRIRPIGNSAHPLAIREFIVDSEPRVAAFQYPVEFTVDVSDAPDMLDWANKVARLCERMYPLINEELASEGYLPPRQIRLTLKNDYRGVAATSGGKITGSVKFFKNHPDDVGAMVHETVHVVQHYRHRGNPGWLVEGIADYIRFFKFEPGNLGAINADPHYNGSYRTSAAFLAFVADKYDKDLVRKLNRLMRAGDYQDATFQDLTGKTLPELDAEWRQSLPK